MVDVKAKKFIYKMYRMLLLADVAEYSFTNAGNKHLTSNYFEGFTSVIQTLYNNIWT